MPKIWRNGITVAVATACNLCPMPALAESRLPSSSNIAQPGIHYRAPASEIDTRIQREVLNQLAGVLDSQYAIEDTARKLAAFLRAKAKSNAYKNIRSGPEFARAVTDDLYSVARDKHLRVNFSLVPVLPPTPGPTGPLPPDVLERMRKENGAIPKVEILDGNVGYVRVNGVPPLAAAGSAVAAAFAFLRNTDALIIDDRGNGGGDPNTVALYVSYLSEGKPFVVNTFHWRAGNRVEEFRTTDLGDVSYGSHKPVYVLTSSMTFSGGEELAYDLQALKRGVVVGETTGGGAHPSDLVPLGSQFVASIPDGQGVNPITGTNWEGTGVIPAVATPAATALNKAHELAIARLAAMATDPETRAELDGVAMELQTIAAAESGTAIRLASRELVGAYTPEVGAGTTVVILEADGRLIRRIDGLPDRALTHSRGNRYSEEGLPEGFYISFRDCHNKIELLLETPSGPSIIRQRQIAAAGQAR